LDTLSLTSILLFDEALVLVYFFSLGYIKEGSLDEDADLLSGDWNPMQPSPCPVS